MEDLNIRGERGDFFVPEVKFSAASGECLISGESFLEDTFAFYNKLHDWMKCYTQEVKGPILLDIRLTYFNTASSKSILELLYMLKEYQEAGGDVRIRWYYKLEDEQMVEDIEDFKEDSGLEIEKVMTSS